MHRLDLERSRAKCATCVEGRTLARRVIRLPPHERRALRTTVAERRRRQNEAAEAPRRMRVHAIAARKARAERGWHLLVIMTLMAQS